MSYSFSVQAPSKDEAKAAVAAKFDEVIASQPMHERDKAAALSNATAVIDLLMDAPDRHISVSVNGYVSWMNVLEAEGSNPLLGASVSASASLVNPD